MRPDLARGARPPLQYQMICNRISISTATASAPGMTEAPSASSGIGRGPMLWGLSLNGWDTLIPFLFAISATFAILGGGATYVALKLHKQEAVNLKSDLERYQLRVDKRVNAAEAEEMAAEQAAKNANFNAAEENRRAGVAELALDQHKLPSVLK